jgi:hypothetical protein
VIHGLTVQTLPHLRWALKAGLAVAVALVQQAALVVLVRLVRVQLKTAEARVVHPLRVVRVVVLVGVLLVAPLVLVN